MADFGGDLDTFRSEAKAWLEARGVAWAADLIHPQQETMP